MNDAGEADPELVAIWARGWSLARGTLAPVADRGGWRIDVGWPHQQARHVFARPCAGLRATAEGIDRPLVWIKLAAPLERLVPLLPPRWRAERRGWMMTLAAPGLHAPTLPPGYAIEREGDDARVHVAIRDGAGGLAASGHLAIVDGHAIHDRIVTEEAHRRRGLGRAVMAALGAAAAERGAGAGLLVATDMGRLLYEGLGWAVHAPYSSAVIPAAGT